MAKLKNKKSPKQKTLLASGDIWKDAGISASPGMIKELEALKITPTKLINTKSSGLGNRKNISDRH